jgi:hypothetical protein
VFLRSPPALKNDAFASPGKSYRYRVDVTDGARPAGWNEIEWSAIDRHGAPLSSGVYLYRLKSGKQVLTRKMTVLK